MDDRVTRELLDELLSALERLEAQNLAALQFIKAQKKGVEKLAPYLEQAEKASGVKWMATRARLNHLLDGAAREAERTAEQSAKTQAKSAGPATKVEEQTQSEGAQSKEAPATKPAKVQDTGKISEPRQPEAASRTVEPPPAAKPNIVESTSNQGDTKPAAEKEPDPTESSV
jgi:hypothetical protein